MQTGKRPCFSQSCWTDPPPDARLTQHHWGVTLGLERRVREQQQQQQFKQEATREQGLAAGTEAEVHGVQVDCKTEVRVQCSELVPRPGRWLRA